MLLAATKLASLAYAVAQGWIRRSARVADRAVRRGGVAGGGGALRGAAGSLGELLYFVALTGTTQALLTPDLGAAFPSFPAATFFLAHGLTVAAVVFLLATRRLSPRPGAWWRSLLAVDAYAASVFALDRVLGANYLYLAHKPPVPTLLDVLGPWPWYLVSCEFLAAAIFLLLQLPFRGAGVRA